MNFKLASWATSAECGEKTASVEAGTPAKKSLYLKCPTSLDLKSRKVSKNEKEEVESRDCKLVKITEKSLRVSAGWDIWNQNRNPWVNE